MKKNGFTLAEVLITLAIIGVVATMTLPALITNTGEQQYKSGLKKGINTLTNAAQMSSAVDGYAYADVLAVDGNIGNDTTEQQTLYSIFAKHLNIDFGMSDSAEPKDGHSTLAELALPNAVYLRDGSTIFFDASVVGTDTAEIQTRDNLPLGYDIVYDTNGVKGPNVLSNCEGEPAGAADAVLQNDQDPPTDETCDAKANRIIKDQFRIRLRGTVAQPSGAAAIWAFHN